MQTLKRIIVKNLLKLSVVMMLTILVIAALLQVLLVQDQSKESAIAAFSQIEQLIKANNDDLESVKAEYREMCLKNAESIAYMIQHNPDILGDLQEFRKIAQMMQVDEIHIFNEAGCIFTGTHPEYYNYTFETGEQIGFFRPMKDDKTLRLCQDITPNTAEGRLVQYSAVWSADGKFIVQVGMYPETVMAYTAKNELSYIFTLLQGNPGVDFYAIDKESHKILGSTTGGDHGKHMTQIGFKEGDLPRCMTGGHVTVSGVNSYAFFRESDDGYYLGYVISQDLLYQNIPVYTLVLTLCLLLIAAVMVLMMTRFTNRYIIRSIAKTNEKLRAIADGNLDERVDVQSSTEFAELSHHINTMIHSLLASTDKLSSILDRTDLRIGVYEYSTKMRSVRYTERTPAILDLDKETTARLSGNHTQLQRFIERLRKNPVPEEENIFRLPGKREVYVRHEEIVNGSDVLGIVMDVTEELLTRRRIEQERDIDPLTGLYNRGALERQLGKLFSEPENLGCGALVMMDADGLKGVNDTYGHATGDLYLKRLGEVLRSFGSAKRVCARQSGDEYVLLLYGYADDNAVMADLARIRYMQNNTMLPLANGQELPVRFSFGYVLTQGRQDYQTMLSEADGYMYAVKRKRKNARQREQAMAELGVDAPAD